jgi:methylthioribose-1-phosphate isomerase
MIGVKRTNTNLDRGVMPLKYEGQRVMLLDQRALPERLEWFDATELESMCEAIKAMVVRGAPSIGVAAAFAMALESMRRARQSASSSEFLAELESARQMLQATRPTAVNLRWGTDQVFAFIEQTLCGTCGDASALLTVSEAALAFAHNILEQHVAANRQLSQFGAALVPAQANVITHCNAGPLAACGWGTAIGVIRSAFEQGKKVHVYVDETRPRNQGAKLTMWELHQDNIPCTLMCDSMSGYLMTQHKIDMVVVGADRIAKNGDTANKIGTYNLAVVARHHNVPFYIAAPLSTIDATIDSGAQIPIEARDAKEVTTICGLSTTVPGAQVYNPAFDVTPCDLIAGIITEYGVLTGPYGQSIERALASTRQQNAS